VSLRVYKGQIYADNSRLRNMALSCQRSVEKNWTILPVESARTPVVSNLQ